MSRGHLAARSDFIYGVHQQASFYFLNAAPQWQTFNGGNWAILEEKLKAHVDRKNLDVDIYTGTHGTLSYADIEGVSREIFLSSKGDSPKVQKIPVPKIYYKIVIAPQQRAGIAFIGVNDPYATKEDILSNFIYCDNIINHVSYIPWKSSLRMGYMYACAVDEFTKYVKELPKLPTIDHVLLWCRYNWQFNSTLKQNIVDLKFISFPFIKLFYIKTIIARKNVIYNLIVAFESG